MKIDLLNSIGYVHVHVWRARVLTV